MKEVLNALWIGVLGFVMIQGYLLSFKFPFFKRGFVSAKWMLVAASLICSFIATIELLKAVLGIENAPHLLYLQTPLWYLLAPVIFLYIRMYSRHGGLKWTDLLHLMPMFWVGLNLMEFYLLPIEAKQQHYEQLNTEISAYLYSSYYVVFSLQSAFYLIACFFLLYGTKNRIKHSTWVLLFISGLAFFTFCGLISLYVIRAELSFIKTSHLFLTWLASFLLLLIYKTDNSVQERNKPAIASISEKHATSNTSCTIYESICLYMEEQHCYRDAAYNIHMLAQEFGHSKNYLETMIKEESGKNFRDFLNDFRIEDAKKKLNSDISKQYTIETIANDSGFNSLATFYRVFKKAEGITPKAYIRT